jgi:phenylalanyl-tRNA synthetase alpha chain
MTVPGMCYRRDATDRTHVGTPQQVDLWWVRPDGPALHEEDLMDLIDEVVTTLLPDSTGHAPPSAHPYTQQGREIYVRTPDGDLEIGECGLAHPDLLRAAGLPAGDT